MRQVNRAEMFHVECNPLIYNGARGRNRTGTINDRGILSPLRLPIPPPGQLDITHTGG